MTDRPPADRPRKGRGAVSNIAHRFESVVRVVDGDALEAARLDGEPLAPPLATQVSVEQARSIITRNDSPDIDFDQSINPYRGCEHGCIYCYARPTHSLLNLSPGLDFETRLIAKANAVALLRAELAARGYVPRLIVVGTATDAYQPIERDLRLTRGVLEVLAQTRHPFGVVTKSALIERDLDLLAPAAVEGLAAASISVTTLDPALARTLEPRAASPTRRLRTIETLARAGVPVGVNVAPVIPFVTEPELERILQAARDAGATSAHMTVLRLPWEVAPLFRAWLAAHFPQRAERVMNRMRDMRGGRDYDAAFGTRMRGAGVWADLLQQRFAKAVARLGLERRLRSALRLDRFEPPPVAAPHVDRFEPPRVATPQLDLF